MISLPSTIKSYIFFEDHMDQDVRTHVFFAFKQEIAITELFGLHREL